MAEAPRADPDGASGRLVIQIHGAVQGVGFRPYLYRLASELGLRGSLRNDSDGVHADLEGAREHLRALLQRLVPEAPQLALVQSLDSSWERPVGATGLRIEHSDSAGATTVVVLPDVASCQRCLAEVADPGNRRHGYPFTNCTDCGPRFSIVQALPYDRPNTTMRGFTLCDECRSEYEDPLDRRFHAQPNACPECGPRLTLVAGDGAVLERDSGALRAVGKALTRGEIVAVKGLGGFHLMVDARNDDAVRRLRARKRRPTKPLALMVADLAAARALCEVPAGAETLLASYQAPIVLLNRHDGAAVAAAVAPDNPTLGLMLPYTPLHRLLLHEVGYPLVATSGNLSDEPICTDNDDALARLSGIADLFLLHDRPVARHVDDSVAWLHGGEPQWVRRARGVAPLPVRLARGGPCVLAVGAHFKNVVGLAVGDNVFLSQHIGDMDTSQARQAFESVVEEFLGLYDAHPVAVAHDLHPDYASTAWAVAATGENAAPGPSTDPGGARARLRGLPLLAVQHHHAHLASCLAEHGRERPALGVTWDGTGLGTDRTIWGGEFLLGNAAAFERVGRLRPFRLPGGDAAVRRPAVIAAALLFDALGPEALARHDLAPVAALSATELGVLPRMLEGGVRSPWTSSAGRLFDGVASLLDLMHRVTFEGEAAIALEFAAAEGRGEPLPMPMERVMPVTTEPGVGADAGPRHEILELDWRPLIRALVGELSRGQSVADLAARFHGALVEGIVAVSTAVGEETVALTGGCFQNRTLGEATVVALRGAGLEPLVQRRVPPNDGGISLGQVTIARARLRNETEG